jgi:hypothetical protein
LSFLLLLAALSLIFYRFSLQPTFRQTKNRKRLDLFDDSADAKAMDSAAVAGTAAGSDDDEEEDLRAVLKLKPKRSAHAIGAAATAAAAAAAEARY